MLTTLSYIGTIIISAGVGFVLCTLWLASRYWELSGQRDRLAVGMSNASNTLRAAGLRADADRAFAVLDENGGIS